MKGSSSRPPAYPADKMLPPEAVAHVDGMGLVPDFPTPYQRRLIKRAHRKRARAHHKRRTRQVIIDPEN